MAQFTASGLPLIEEHEATEPVAELFDQIKREMQFPDLPNIIRVLGGSPAALATHWAFVRAFYQNTTLPRSLVSMILFAIAEKKQCRYCSANHELSCRTLGIDEATLQLVITDLPLLNPERIRVTLAFALKVAESPQALTPDDYEDLRAQGVSDEELVEIVQVAALGSYMDILAEALQVEVDAPVAQALQALVQR